MVGPFDGVIGHTAVLSLLEAEEGSMLQTNLGVISARFHVNAADFG